MEINHKAHDTIENLVWNKGVQAEVWAIAEDPGAMIGMEVRRSDQDQNSKRAVGRGKAQLVWNTGVAQTGWVVTIYNLSGPDGLRLKVEAR